MMQLNRSGAATQPCLTPLEMVNQLEIVLLMRTQVDVSVYSRSILAQSWVGCRWSGECVIGNRGLPSQNAALRSMKAMKSARSFQNSRPFQQAIEWRRCDPLLIVRA